MVKNTLRISVIIPTMNRLESLMQTMQSLSATKPAPYEVIVVDQTMDLGQADAIKEYCLSCPLNVHYKWNFEPSLTKARNTGFMMATGDLIVYMDDDVDVKSDVFRNVTELFNNNTLAMAGGVNELEDLSHQSVLGVLFGKSSFFKRKKGHVTKSVYGRYPVCCSERTMSEWAMGFFFVVRKELMEKWNLRFDENLQYYAFAEDLDFTYSYYKRAKKDALNCCFSSLLTVRHNVSMEYRIPKRKETFMNVLHRRYIRSKLMRYNIFAILLCWWSDFGDILFRIAHKEPAIDIIRAQWFYLCHRADICRGVFHYELFM